VVFGNVGILGVADAVAARGAVLEARVGVFPIFLVTVVVATDAGAIAIQHPVVVLAAGPLIRNLKAVAVARLRTVDSRAALDVAKVVPPGRADLPGAIEVDERCGQEQRETQALQGCHESSIDPALISLLRQKPTAHRAWP
jgi:hypothetical protein